MSPSDRAERTRETGVAPEAVSFAEALRAWAALGLLSFGGPSGQIALMHRMLVEERRWLSEGRFLHALNFCMLLPGPEAMQLATYTGWLLHGWRGGLAAGLLFVLPGALVVFVLSAIYAAFGQTVLVEAVFFGVKAAVLAIVIEALRRIAGRALKGRVDWTVAFVAFIAMFFLSAPFPLVVLAAGLVGFLAGGSAAPSSPDDEVDEEARPPVSWRRTLATVALWFGLWLGPLALLTLVLGPEHVLSQVGWFFSKLAVVTFGGAYAVLAYMAQQAVEGYAWLAPGQMLDGLGLAETTPGPLILVTVFVGFLAGWGEAGGGSMVLMASVAALVTLWATFAPCFLWIFAGAPYIERLRGNVRLRRALAAITAAVVGVILNLSLWFGLHVLFAQIEERSWWVVRLLVPSVASLDVAAAALFVIAAIALFRFRLGVPRTLALCAALGLLARLVL